MPSELDKMKTRVLEAISDGPLTIPAICKKLKIGNEYRIMAALARLERDNLVHLSGFDKFYEPDGCAGYLAKYGKI